MENERMRLPPYLQHFVTKKGFARSLSVSALLPTHCKAKARVSIPDPQQFFFEIFEQFDSIVPNDYSELFSFPVATSIIYIFLKGFLNFVSSRFVRISQNKADRTVLQKSTEQRKSKSYINFFFFSIRINYNEQNAFHKWLIKIKICTCKKEIRIESVSNNRLQTTKGKIQYNSIQHVKKCSQEFNEI